MSNSNGDQLFTVHITFHGAENLPVADLLDLSCDPYLEATVVVPSMPRDSELPPLTWRTPTIRQTRDPIWDCSWVVAGIPSSGFLLEMRVKDEDLRDRDDRLGKAIVDLTAQPSVIREGYSSKKQKYKIKKRKGSFRPWIQTYVAALIPGQKLRKHNRIIVSIEVLWKTEDQYDRRVYTIGPNKYSQHFSPLIGHIVNKGSTQHDSPKITREEDGRHREVSASTFIAHKLQLTGPIPKELHHHYVGYRPFITWLFSNSGILGHLLNQGLRKQYRTLYSYDKSTVYGAVEEDPDHAIRADDHDSGVYTNSSNDGVHVSVSLPSPGNDHQQPENKTFARVPPNEVAMARQFLKMTSWGTGYKLFTYVITVDGEWRFTETGDEFTIDMLSKHSMHADAVKVVAYSGEFFVRRIEQSEDSHDEQNPKEYELIIDNDSGTYRPKKELLPLFREWLSDEHNLGGLGHVIAMDGFDQKLVDMKKQRKEQKKAMSGGELPKHTVVRRAGSSASSVSGSRIGLRTDISSSDVQTMLSNLENKNDKHIETSQHESSKPGESKQ